MKSKAGYIIIDNRYFKVCKENEERNPSTLRCRKKKSEKKRKLSKVNVCKAGYEYINRKCLKTCQPGSIRNISTSRCKKVTVKKSSKRISKSVKRKSKSPIVVRKSKSKSAIVVRKSPVISSRRSSASSIDEDNEDDQEHDEYMNIFMDQVNDLPFITYEDDEAAGEEPYSREMLIEDIVNIIQDIYKSSGYVLVPDSETMEEIANIKFDSNTKGKNKNNKFAKMFLFGTQKGRDGVVDKIREFTRKIEKHREDLMEQKYKNYQDDDDIVFN